MVGLFIAIIIFSLLNGITISIILYLSKKYLLKRQSNFKKNIRIGAIVAIFSFALATFLILGMEHN